MSEGTATPDLQHCHTVPTAMSVSLANLRKQLKATFESPNPTHLWSELAVVIHAFVEAVSSFSADATSVELVEVLQEVYDQDFDQNSAEQQEVFLATLHELEKALPSFSIATTWWDLLLRPSLRNPSLSASAVQKARSLVLKAMSQPVIPSVQGKVLDFRTRIIELYLHDAPSISSGDELIEKASWDELERERRLCWNANLREILSSFFFSHASEFLDQFGLCFGEPTRRIQLVLFLSHCVSQDSFANVASNVFAHKTFEDILTSLLVDKSCTLFNLELSLFTQLLPYLTIYEADKLQSTLPYLLLALHRSFSWISSAKSAKSRYYAAAADTAEEDHVTPDDPNLEETGTSLDDQLLPELKWEILRSDTSTPHLPAADSFFGMLWTLFPCNTLLFLRSPQRYVDLHTCNEFYIRTWRERIDRNQLRSDSQCFLEKNSINPRLLDFNDDDHYDEVKHSARWGGSDVGRLVGDYTRMFSTKLNYSDHYTYESLESSFIPGLNQDPQSEIERGVQTSHADFVTNPAHGQLSSIDRQSDNFLGATAWSNLAWGGVGVSALGSKSSTSLASSMLPPATPIHDADLSSSHLVDTLLNLQRENLLLRNELKFEKWSKHQSVKSSETLLARAATLQSDVDTEFFKRQKNVTKYRRRCSELETELKKHKAQASLSIAEHKTWSKSQEDKITEMRRKERGWSKEASVLRDRNKLLDASMQAQDKLLADAKKQIFKLETRMKEIKPRLDRLSDFEAKIEQLTKLQELWDDDVQRYNKQADQMELFISDHNKMKLRLTSLEQANLELQRMLSARHRSEQTDEPISPTRLSHQPSQAMMNELTARVQLLESVDKGLLLKSSDLSDQLREAISSPSPAERHM